ncbi:flagellar assembly peptidoglycan hydrolase FlgJ, partial [Pseudomaricurvus sp.]|uniref:flagellar assembly peptidoglycan hydrolase FlgJ n=1 Tax=Pseudomaricurvus sp. TaxID=2004510 RepID=UPI003F6D2CA1
RETQGFEQYFKNIVEKVIESTTEATSETSISTDVSTKDTANGSTFDGPLTLESFKEHLLLLARKAAEALGVHGEVLLSQAALETGWGKHLIKDESGQNSYNLFGIKADSSWQGDKAVVSTLEYRDGVPVRERASFRAYSSFAESFQDYVSFIKNNSRYQEALKAASDAVEYVKGLQQAGYATDPKYADKIIGIVEQHFPERLKDRG